jgi:hypothetical protein
MQHKLSFNTKPESNGVPIHDLKNRLPYLSMKQSHITAPERLGKPWIDLQKGKRLEEIVLMSLNCSFYWNLLDIARPISAEVSRGKFWDGRMGIPLWALQELRAMGMPAFSNIFGTSMV